jgi:hypothetical protein
MEERGKRCQKNGGRKMKSGPLRSKKGGGCIIFFDMDVSNMGLVEMRKYVMGEL